MYCLIAQLYFLQVSARTAAEHAELVRNVENMNVLQESNRLLRDEKEALARRVASGDAQLQKLQQTIDPLTSSLAHAETQRDVFAAEVEALKHEIER